MGSSESQESASESERASAPWLVVGLGNPGSRYERTRHNAGFMVVDEIASRLGTQVKRNDCGAQVGRGDLEGQKLDLVKPQTFMNLSGQAVSCLLRKEGRRIGRLLVIVDDIALPFGVIRVRKKGSAGGHNGLRSIIAETGTDGFARLRIGIMPDHPVNDTKRFVLDEFPASARDELQEIIIRSADAVEKILKEGYDAAMSEFNG